MGILQVVTSESTPRTAAEIEAAVEAAVEEDYVEDTSGHEPMRFLSRTGVAHHLGLVGLYSLTDVTLPPPDAIIGNRKGWKPETIDAWNAQRPGRGRWGKRSETGV